MAVARCTFTWQNRYGDTYRCMLDEGHNSMLEGHKHGLMTVWEVDKKNGSKDD